MIKQSILLMLILLFPSWANDRLAQAEVRMLSPVNGATIYAPEVAPVAPDDALKANSSMPDLPPGRIAVDVGDVDGDGKKDRLILKKRPVRSDTHYRVFTWNKADGYKAYPAPEVRTYRGYVESDPDMRVNANIEDGNRLNANLSDGRNINVRLTELPVKLPPSKVAKAPTGNVPISLKQSRQSPTPRGYVIPTYNMRRILVAADIWHDYSKAFNNDVDAAIARMEQRVNDTDFFYARDMGIAWELTTVVVRTEKLEGRWKKEWSKTLVPAGAKYNVAVKFKKPGGGGARGQIFDSESAGNMVYCEVGTTAAYSRSLGHEVGHQFGFAGHSSSWSDIMGGAKSCIGAGTVQRMITHSNLASKSLAPAITYGAPLPPYAMEDAASTQVDQSVEINVLENDYDGNGDEIYLEYTDPKTNRGGATQIVKNGVICYTPPKGFHGMDEFTYHVTDPDGLSNRQGHVKVYVGNPGLVMHLRFDETKGEIARDVGPCKTHGELKDGLSFTNSVPGRKGRALRRTKGDGKSARVECDGVGDPLDSDLSISLWVKYDKVPTASGTLICKGGVVIPSRFERPRGGWFIGHVEGKGFRFGGNLQRDNDGEKFNRESTQKIQANTWYHLVMVLDREMKQVRAWVNNKEVKNSTWGTRIEDGVIEASHRPLVIFNSQSSQEKSKWSGPATIDDVRIYNKALSASNVAELFK